MGILTAAYYIQVEVAAEKSMLQHIQSVQYRKQQKAGKSNPQALCIFTNIFERF